MLILRGGIVMLAALNMVVNTGVGLMILLHCPCMSRLSAIRWPDFLREKLDLKAREKGENRNEETME